MTIVKHLDDYQKRKQARKEYFEKHIKGKKLISCIVCNGSGYYDFNGSPYCVCCNGTGKVREY